MSNPRLGDTQGSEYVHGRTTVFEVRGERKGRHGRPKAVLHGSERKGLFVRREPC
jgi:hypothetical protein